MNSILTFVCTLLLAGCLHAAAQPDGDSFWIEFEGQLQNEQIGGQTVVRVIPEEGLPLRIGQGIASDWRRWEGQRVEAEGLVGYDGSDAVMQARELPREDDGPGWKRAALDTEGVLMAGTAGPFLRTKSGDAPLTGFDGSIPVGLPVELKGNLALENGRLAIRVVWAEVD